MTAWLISRHSVDVVAESGAVAFVLGGGGVLGATQVGMLRALVESGIHPDLVVGSSVGALNGAMIASAPVEEAVQRLIHLWTSLSDSAVFAGGLIGRARTLVSERTHLHPSTPLRRLLDESLPASFDALRVPFQCVAAEIETASAHWFSSGPLIDAVLASCAVPGLLPPVALNGAHYLDGGLVHSIPVGRAIALGARTVYVLHVGRIEQPLKAPRWPWEVGLVAFEIARRHRFVAEMTSLPDGTDVIVLPSGMDDTPSVSVKYRGTSRVRDRIERAYRASCHALADRP